MCNFPAARLLERRRTAFDNNDTDTAIAIVKAIDEKRFEHEEQTGCDCWAKAIEASPNPLAPALAKVGGA